MAIRSFATPVDATAYTKVGSNVTTISITERLVGELRVVVTDVGDSEPDVTETQFIPFDEGYERDRSARDIWVLSPLGPTIVYGEAE